MQTAPTPLRTTVRALSLALLSLGFGVTHAKLPPPPFLGAPPAAGAAAGSDPQGNAPFMLGAPGLSPSLQAGAEPGPHHFGSIEQFKFSPNVVFEIRARVGSFVNVEVPANEQIIGFYLSDTTLWRFVVAQDQSRILVKAGRAGLSNSATLVTNRRVYELSFLAVPSGQPWHQRVQWSADQPQSHAWGVFEPAFRAFADPAAMRPAQAAQPGGAAPAQAAAPAGATASAPAAEVAVDANRVNFGWSIEGDAPFRPLIVFDDGRFTYIRMPAVQDLPALFAQDEGQLRIVDYAVRGDLLVVGRVSESFVLRLGQREVRVVRHASGQ